MSTNREQIYTYASVHNSQDYHIDCQVAKLLLYIKIVHILY